jgi:hypothetical protein
MKAVAPIEQYRLPGGAYTDSRKLYLQAWEELYMPVAEALGCEVLSFDPGITMSYAYSCFCLPVPVAQRIAELVKENNV